MKENGEKFWAKYLDTSYHNWLLGTVKEKMHILGMAGYGVLEDNVLHFTGQSLFTVKHFSLSLVTSRAGHKARM